MKELGQEDLLQDGRLDSAALRELCLKAGADDAACVSIDAAGLDEEKQQILSIFPASKSLVSFVCRLNREPLRSPARSIANLEGEQVGKQINRVARDLVRRLEDAGVGSINPAMGFPMELQHFPERAWSLSHKTVAEAAGLGRTGWHRNLIHPRFGTFVLLGSLVLDKPLTESAEPLKENPCLNCRLCVSACPTGAIGADGRFNFSACYTHNYRELLSGFSDWVETVAASRSARDYRRQVSDTETVSMWQNLAVGANYQCSHCLGVCPAGSQVSADFLRDRKAFTTRVVKPLCEREETVHVLAGSDAEHQLKQFPNKRAHRVHNGLRPPTISAFLDALPLIFQPGQAKNIEATYHFRFFGEEQAEATIRISNGNLEVNSELVGEPNLRVSADSRSWLAFVARERNIARLLLTRRIRLKGSPKLLMTFGRCFPG